MSRMVTHIPVSACVHECVSQSVRATRSLDRWERERAGYGTDREGWGREIRSVCVCV